LGNAAWPATNIKFYVDILYSRLWTINPRGASASLQNIDKKDLKICNWQPLAATMMAGGLPSTQSQGALP
jgi:hypothetical protein